MTTGHHEPVTGEITSWDDIPAFASEAEEAAYWETHSLGDALLAELAEGPGDPRLPPPRPRTKPKAEPISLRLDPDMREQLKTIARERGTGYQTLIKQWLAERLAAEAAGGQQAHGADMVGSAATPPTGSSGGVQFIQFNLGIGVAPHLEHLLRQVPTWALPRAALAERRHQRLKAPILAAAHHNEGPDK